MPCVQQTISLSSNDKFELIDITDQVESIVANSGIKNGLCHVFVAHSTAGIIGTENESGLINDFYKLFATINSLDKFEHDRIDNNAASHLLSGMIGQERTFPIKNNQLVRGTWQNIFFAEYDGPRSSRTIHITITGE